MSADPFIISSPAFATVPTGSQTVTELARRRLGFAVAVGATWLVLGIWLASIVFSAGPSLLGLLLLIAFLIELPWTAIGFWNALLGIFLIYGSRDPVAAAMPLDARGEQPITVRTAVLMTLRNEDPARAFLRLKAVKDSLDATGHGAHFDYFVLSDSTLPEVIAAEETAMEYWRREVPEAGRVMYRRRKENTGFKAGNVYDFCQRWGLAYELMLPFDADSLMDGATIVRMVRLMQGNPRLGILQSMIVGTPTKSLFARLFQFGMRHAMRTYSLGSSLWQADCGPFWGHNALIRIAPFLEHCRLKDLPGDPPFGGTILSHDQVEGALMRRGGYEVRVLPDETGSYEDNPPTLAEFLRRNARWCNGNLQYLKLWHMLGLLPASRFHFALALELFFSQAAMLTFVVCAALLAAAWPAGAAFPWTSAVALYAVWMFMFFSTKLFAVVDVILRDPQRFGGRLRLIGGFFVESIFTFLLVPIVCVASTLTMIGLLFGRRIGWDGQRRDDYRVSWKDAAIGLWPQTALGTALLLLLAFAAPDAIPWFLPFLAGLVLAIPFAVLTTSPELGASFARWRLCAIPEEIEMPPEIAKVRRAFANYR